jgi:hypothetical protein
VNPTATADDWWFGISPEGIGTLGMLLNFAVSACRAARVRRTRSKPEIYDAGWVLRAGYYGLGTTGWIRRVGRRGARRGGRAPALCQPPTTAMGRGAVGLSMTKTTRRFSSAPGWSFTAFGTTWRVSP